MGASLSIALPADIQYSAWIFSIQEKSNLPIWKPNDTSWVIPNAAFAIWQVAGEEAELLSIAVEPAQRRRGFGKAILEHSIKELAQIGVKKFFLEAREGNAAAILLYEKLGFAKIGVRKGYYADGEHAACFESKVLLPSLDARIHS